MYNSNLGDSRYYQEQVAKIENGGLFNRERCTQLTKYPITQIDNCLKCTMTTKMESYRPSPQAKC